MKKEIIKSSKEMDDTLNSLATVVTIGDNEYYYLPYWFKKSDKGYEVLRFGKLPIDLIKAIKKIYL